MHNPYFKRHFHPLPLQSFVNADRRPPPLQTAVCLQFSHSLYLQSNLTLAALPFPGRQSSVTLLLQSGTWKPCLCFHTMTPGVNKHDLNRVTHVYFHFCRVPCVFVREEGDRKKGNVRCVLLLCFFNLCPHTQSTVWPS